ncbi:MAG: AAA family ATPase [Phycisphaerales bacterium]|nr:AAA family ATPase [Phycisphaerales bacterium]
MKIVSLQAENVKKLVAVEITPDGNMVAITGRNGAGKTSVLDAIWWALAGASHIQSAPIRNGAKSARIRLDLGEIIVTRTFAKSADGEKVTTSLVVENADGARFPSPQKMLDDLIGALTFDPLAFTRMSPKEQLATLRQFVSGVDFDQIETLNKIAYDSRRDINRELKRLIAQRDAIEVAEGDLREHIDEDALVRELEEAGEHNAEIERRKAKRDQVAAEAEQADTRASELDAEIMELKEQIADLEHRARMQRDMATHARTRLAEAEALQEPIDTAALSDRIKGAREVNALIDAQDRAIKARDALEVQIAEKQTTVETLNAGMQERADAMAKAVSEAELPVAGIAFEEDHVTFNGVPLEQASDAEQLRVSVAVAAAMNPKLRVIRIRDGSLLDSVGMQLLGELADEQNLQCWIEKVDESGKIGFVIEDGHLANADDNTEAA